MADTEVLVAADDPRVVSELAPLMDPVGRARAELHARYGRPTQLKNAGDALRLLGKRDETHPHACIALRYHCMEEAETYAELNRHAFGHTVYGPADTADGVIAVVDYWGQMEARGIQRLDPSEPDERRPRVDRCG